MGMHDDIGRITESQFKDMSESPSPFEQWLSKVDEVLSERYGVVSADLPDCNYYAWYDNGMVPYQAAVKAARIAGSY